MIKATDLMIGDWIMVSSNDSINNDIRGRAVQVLGLREEDAEIRVDLCGHDEYSDFWSDDEDDFEPIPLTPEIIRENGFKDTWPGYFEEDKHGMLELHYDSRKGQILWSINYCEYEIIPLNYVHELQHALKLCGIEKEIIL